MCVYVTYMRSYTISVSSWPLYHIPAKIIRSFSNDSSPCRQQQLPLAPQ